MIDAVYRAESRRVLATLIRLLGGFELAEEALHEAFANVRTFTPWPSTAYSAGFLQAGNLVVLTLMVGTVNSRPPNRR